MKLAIIGNGFDLHHGLKTSFNQFRAHLSAMKEDQLINDVDNLIKGRNGQIGPNLCWNDVERCFYNEYLEINKQADKPQVKKKLRNLEFLVEEFTSKLYEYLNKIMEDCDCNLNPTISSELLSAQVILTFNYTDSYKVYNLNENIDIFHIHGNLSMDYLPLIGFYSGRALNPQSKDYLIKFGGCFLNKPAIAMKQNDINFESNLEIFQKKHMSKINEIVILGFSFGESDDHIYNLLNNLLIKQQSENNMSYKDVEAIEKINIKIFSYDDNETDKIINNIKEKMFIRNNRRFTVNKTGQGFHPIPEDTITLKKLNY